MDLLFRITEKGYGFEFFSSYPWFKADRVIGAQHGMMNNFGMGFELRMATMLEF